MINKLQSIHYKEGPAQATKTRLVCTSTVVYRDSKMETLKNTATLINVAGVSISIGMNAKKRINICLLL